MRLVGQREVAEMTIAAALRDFAYREMADAEQRSRPLHTLLQQGRANALTVKGSKRRVEPGSVETDLPGKLIDARRPIESFAKDRASLLDPALLPVSEAMIMT